MILRKAFSAVFAATALVVVPTAAASAAVVHPSSTTTVTPGSVAWKLTDAKCSNVPAGMTLDGTGTITYKFTLRNNADGTTTLTFDDHAAGTAVDQAGNVYQWRYHNRLSQTNSLDAPSVFIGKTTDSFVLHGPGPFHLNNGFAADITFYTDINFPVFDVRAAHGDPYDFANLVNRCDPL